ncbi:hypothetical protein [Halomonas sp. A29]|uniref:hypothetical protein n=1 Tax=Halomonas sp. A29 TaxID=3102786 RepID=UPI00398B1909
MFARVLIGMTFVAGILPLSVLAQEDGTTDEQVVGEVVVEESEPVSREQARDDLDAAIEQNPEAAVFGLESAREAVTEGDGQAVSETASDGRAASGHGSETAAGVTGGGMGNAGAAGSGGGAGGRN